MNPIRLSRPGIYLLRPPSIYSVLLAEELLICLAATLPKVTGVVLYQNGKGVQSVTQMLDSLWENLRSELELSPNQVTAKVFGMKHTNLFLMRAVSKWLEEKGIALGNCDTGKRLSRNLQIDVQNNRVGVFYEKLGNHFFLSQGTARNRRQNPVKEKRSALIISGSRVTQTLAKAAFEELEGWSATSVSSFERAVGKPLGWDVILMTDDVPWMSRWGTWIESLAKNHPEIELAWSGQRPPPFTSSIIQCLPRLNEHHLSEFKRALRSQYNNPWRWTSEGTLLLKRSKKR